MEYKLLDWRGERQAGRLWTCGHIRMDRLIAEHLDPLRIDLLDTIVVVTILRAGPTASCMSCSMHAGMQQLYNAASRQHRDNGPRT